MGLDLSAVGNHEFDEGVAELLRMQNGGCHPDDGCPDGDGFGGADFPYLAANVVDDDTGKPVFPPYAIRKRRRRQGRLHRRRHSRTRRRSSRPSGVAGLKFLDEADTINRYAPELQAAGRARDRRAAAPGRQRRPRAGQRLHQPVGPIVDIIGARRRGRPVPHRPHPPALQLRIDGKRVTSAYSFGRLVTDIDLRIDRRTARTSP